MWASGCRIRCSLAVEKMKTATDTLRDKESKIQPIGRFKKARKSRNQTGLLLDNMDCQVHDWV